MSSKSKSKFKRLVLISLLTKIPLFFCLYKHWQNHKFSALYHCTVAVLSIIALKLSHKCIIIINYTFVCDLEVEWCGVLFYP